MAALVRSPRVPRSSDRVVAGVAGGWAARWRVEPTVVRAAVGVLTLVGGIGAVLYGLAALTSTSPSPTRVGEIPPTTSHVRRELAIGFATAAMLVAARSVGLWPGDEIMGPAAAVALGVAVVWSNGARHGASALAHGTLPGRVLQIGAGLALLCAGVISLANRTGGLGNVGASAGAIAVVIGGLAMFAAPAVGRIVRTLDDERALRIREDERAMVAAHLHDSVLQSLVLIQRAADPRRMSSIARRQERELRSWLYDATPTGGADSLHAALDALTVEIETDHDVRVEAVVVGDQPSDEAARTLVAALREAILNAAQHADVGRVDVFVEADDAELTGFVRDTGRGFDLDRIPDDRRGISDSIIGRIQRAGGAATLNTRPGAGTEIELRMPRRRR